MASSRRRHVEAAATKTTQRVNLQIDVDAYRRLLLHAIMDKEQPGAIVSRLIDTHLKRWAMPADLSARGKSSDRLELADDVNLAAEPKAA